VKYGARRSNWDCFLCGTYSVIITESQFKIAFITFMSVTSDAVRKLQEGWPRFLSLLNF